MNWRVYRLVGLFLNVFDVGNVAGVVISHSVRHDLPATIWQQNLVLAQGLVAVSLFVVVVIDWNTVVIDAMYAVLVLINSFVMRRLVVAFAMMDWNWSSNHWCYNSVRPTYGQRSELGRGYSHQSTDSDENLPKS